MLRLGSSILSALPLAASLLAAGAVPAAAAELPTLTCPLATLPAGDRPKLEDAVRRQSRAEDPGIQALYRSVYICSRQHQWSEAAAQQAVIYTLADIGQRQARATLEGWGIDMPAVERALLADRAAMNSARSNGAGDQMSAFFERLPAPLRQSIESHGTEGAEALGAFLVFRAAVENSRADFAAR